MALFAPHQWFFSFFSSFMRYLIMNLLRYGRGSEECYTVRFYLCLFAFSNSNSMQIRVAMYGEEEFKDVRENHSGR